MIAVTKYFKSGLIQNTFFLFLNKGINVIVPIIIIPLCHKLFGIESYGEWVYVQSMLFVFVLIFDYGFNLSAPRAISTSKNNLLNIQNIYSSILIFKFVLSILIGVLLVGYLLFTKSSLLLLFVFTYMSLSLQSLIPYWFFQGMQENKYISYINLFSKIFIFFPFLFLNAASLKIYHIPLFETFAYLITLLVALLFIKKEYKCRIKKINYLAIVKQLKEGNNIFITSLISWLIVSGSVIVVEHYATKFELGYFATFTRIGYYMYALFQPINHAIFPYVAVKFAESKKNGLNFLKKIELLYFGIVALIISSIILLNKLMFKLFLGSSFMIGYDSYTWVFIIICFWIGLLLINNFLGIQYLLGDKKDKVYRNFCIVNGIIFLVGIITLTPNYHSLGAAISMCTGEFMFFLLYLVKVKSIKN